jgi:hypothetical protein
MPRTIIARPPGGASGKVRKRYAIRQKLKLLEECSRLRRSMNLTLRGAALEIGISPCLLVQWTNQRHRYEASLGKKKAICVGPVGQLDSIREELLQWIFARQEQGIAVTMSHVVYKATSILSHLQEDCGGGFKDSCFTARLSAVTRFLAKFDSFIEQKLTRQQSPWRRSTRRRPRSWRGFVQAFVDPIVIHTSSLTWIRRPLIFRITARKLSPSVGSRLCTCGSLCLIQGERRVR